MVGLSERSRRILAGLADGHSVEQILAWDLALRYGDVAEAARAATPRKPAPTHPWRTPKRPTKPG